MAYMAGYVSQTSQNICITAAIDLKTKSISWTKGYQLGASVSDFKCTSIVIAPSASNFYTVGYTEDNDMIILEIEKSTGNYIAGHSYDFDFGNESLTSFIYSNNIYALFGKTSTLGMYKIPISTPSYNIFRSLISTTNRPPTDSTQIVIDSTLYLVFPDYQSTV